MRRALAATLLVASIAATTPPASADSSLGGYSASAEAAVVRIGIYEPAIPIPADPEVDASIGYARSTTTTGPSARGLASYLWPGDAVGDGLGVLLGNEALDYPVKSSSNFPATDTGPAQNAVQINDGNGMSTSADGETTQATVVGLGLGNGIGDPGKGLCKLMKKCPTQPTLVNLPDPIAAAATIESLKSTSTVVLGDKSITATARSVASGISILGGIIAINGLDLRSESTSDGATGAPSGTLNITGLIVLGRKIDLGSSTSIGGKPATAPKLPQLLKALGITIEYLQNQKSESGATGSLNAQGLTITLDVAVLRNLLKLSGLSEPLASALSNIDQLGPLLTGLLQLGTKIVITVGDVRTSAKAGPAYLFPTGPTAQPTTPPVDASGSPPSALAPFPGLAPGQPATIASPPVLTAEPTSVYLPGLGRVPMWFVLAGLALVGLAAMGTRRFGTLILGGGNCLLGKSIGVPDLRKARLR
ncbi:MAG: hypothetical protein JWR83_2758 [Aeromicrobium sp.]|nr:hypothetical protein [Aeromicrobium sp.]